MNLITPLISGIRGAENGHAELFKRGTSNPATWYGSFEADGPISSGAVIPLDANGGVEVYVDELVDVVVKDPDGTTIRSFTAGDSSPPIEVRSPSFTGADYASAASAAGNPTTLQSVLDLWKTQNGAIDWQVHFNGGSATIQAALSQLNGKLFYNVKDVAYGAVGDGFADDTSAIQNCINAVQTAGGGTVVFPDGVYKITAELSVGAGVSLWGMAPYGTIGGTFISMTHATAHILRFPVSPTRHMHQEVRNLALTAAVGTPNSGACVIVATGVDPEVHFFNCHFGSGQHTGDLIRGQGLTFTDCFFQIVPTTNQRAFNQIDFTSNENETTRFIRCLFYIDGGGAYTPADGMLNARSIILTDCTFDIASMSSGTAYMLDCESPLHVVATGNRVIEPAGGTVRLFFLGAIDNAARIFEDFNIVDGSEGSTLRALYHIDTITGTAASFWQGFWLGSRERNSLNIASDAASLDLSTMQYALIVNERSNVTVQTLSADAAIPNGSFTLITKNSSGGAGGNITMDSADFRPAETFSIATSTSYDVRRWRGADVDSLVRWFADAMPRNDI